MPVDRQHSRHYQGRTLGEATVWDCPACGQRNEGRTPETGCTHCGAGTPGVAGKVEVPHADVVTPQVDTRMSGKAPQSGTTERAGGPLSKVYRLLEYTIREGQLDHFEQTLRRALVGRHAFSWGDMVGTIVDDVSPRQQDLLQLARRQPGVWLGGPRTQETIAQRINRKEFEQSAADFHNESRDRLKQRYERTKVAMANDELPPPEPPLGGRIPGAPDVHPDARRFAEYVNLFGGRTCCYTLAMALQMVANEVEGNIESYKFLSKTECLELATALLELVPDDWNPEGDGDGGQT